MFDRQIEESIEIVATPAEVWWHLTNFAAYAHWNPFIVDVRGELAQGVRLTLMLHIDGLPPVPVRAKVLVVRPESELRWRAGIPLYGLLEGEHAFVIEPLGPERVRLIQCETFSGLLASGALSIIEKQTRWGLRAMNEALRRRAEATHARAEAARSQRRHQDVR